MEINNENPIGKQKIEEKSIRTSYFGITKSNKANFNKNSL